MDRLLFSCLAAFVAFVGFGAQAVAQMTRDQLLIGQWACTVSGAESPYERISVDFGADRASAITFFAVANGGAVRMTLTVMGAWTYDPATGDIRQSFATALIDNIVVNGRPMTRSEFPGGEASLASM